MVQALCFTTNFQYLLYNTVHQQLQAMVHTYFALHQQLQAMVLYNTIHSTSSCKQWCCTILCTPPAAESNGAVQTMHSTSSCKQWCCIILCTPPAASSNGTVQYYALHQQLQAMVLYNTMHSTSSCKQWCSIILCSPPAAANNGVAQFEEWIKKSSGVLEVANG